MSKSKLLRNSLFILIAIAFVFSYPNLLNSWNLNIEIGWFIPKRPAYTYFIPIWFLIIFGIYHWLVKKDTKVIKAFFWVHFLVSLIPVFLINYPFVGYNLKTFYLGSTLALLYFFSQIILFLLLIIIVFLNRKIPIKNDI